MDGRLWICGIAVAIAMFGLAWDFLYPFPLSRPVLIICSGSYLFTPPTKKRVFSAWPCRRTPLVWSLTRSGL